MDEWTREQLLIAMEFKYWCPERMHTDAHPMCQEVAHMIGRTAGGLDAIIRNIKHVETQGTGFAHASQRIKDMVEEFSGRPNDMLAEAGRVHEKNGWPPIRCHD